ncbi:MAG: methyltransferase domain-containing protein [Myxococcaceae bacterium]|nr:methyltransferase domain-containing protein [Myxococcaceae bacterium]
MRSPCLLLALLTACAHSHHDMQHRFDDAEKWAKQFDDPARDAWQKPQEVIDALKLAPDAVVADIGSGTGYFAVRLARAVPQGKVYGVDIEPAMTEYLAQRAEKTQLANVTAVTGSAGDTKLPEEVDLALVVDTYHHIEVRSGYFARLPLKPGGRLAIIDYRKGQPMGPPEAYRVDVPQLKEELEGAGYKLVAEHTFLPNQYFVVFSRP